MNRTFDCVVVGAGVFGSWIAYSLRQAGRSVALIEREAPANSKGSSAGESRIIRIGYGQQPFYSRWAAEALPLWRELAERSGRQPLFVPTGVLWTAHGDHPHFAGTRDSLRQLRVPFEELNHGDLGRRFPHFHFPEGTSGIFEPESGVLLARRAVTAVVLEAVVSGSEYLQRAVEPPSGTGRLASVRLATGESLQAETFVFACGPWMRSMFPRYLRDLLTVTRQDVFFFDSAPLDGGSPDDRMPVSIDFSDERGPYLLPDVANEGLKLAFDQHGPEFDPDNDDRRTYAKRDGRARAFVSERLRGMESPTLRGTSVCQYTNTSNGDFLIDRHPDFDNVWLVTGGSGHGFKHGPVVGRYVAKLIETDGIPEPRLSLATKAAKHARVVY